MSRGCDRPRWRILEMPVKSTVWLKSKTAAAAGKFGAAESLSRRGGQPEARNSVGMSPSGGVSLLDRASFTASRVSSPSRELRSGVSTASWGLPSKSPPASRSAGDKVVLLIPEHLSLAKDFFLFLPRSQKFHFPMTLICLQSGR